MTDTQIANALIHKRLNIGRARGQHVTQIEIAGVIGVSPATYKLAERHGIARARARDKVLEYLNTPVNSIVEKWFAPRVQGNRKRRVR